MSRKLFISVAGSIGSGKTTVAKLLSEKLKIHLIEENFGENAFLPRFYKNMRGWAFESQTFFLMEKTAQLLKIRTVLSNAKDLLWKKHVNGIIQDVPIYQDVFSYAKAQYVLGNMDAPQWKLYQKIYRSFESMLPKPQYIINLVNNIETIKKRISSRNREFEQQIPDKYLLLLEKLNSAWMKREARSVKFISIPTDKINLVRNVSDIKNFVQFIKKSLHVYRSSSSSQDFLE